MDHRLVENDDDLKLHRPMEILSHSQLEEEKADFSSFSASSLSSSQSSSSSSYLLGLPNLSAMLSTAAPSFGGGLYMSSPMSTSSSSSSWSIVPPITSSSSSSVSSTPSWSMLS